MYRDHTCGELRIENVGTEVTLSGWVQKSRDLGGMTFVDLRDRYGVTQLAFNEEVDAALCAKARELGREFVIQAKGKVAERSSKNPKMSTGDIEIIVSGFEILNAAKLPPFLIEDETDGGEELRMKYRYLDLRRNPEREKLRLRHRVAIEVRKYLDGIDFMEVETPVLIKSTPEGARDFVVPSRMNPGQFYALPQSPQTFKQLMMVSGFDKYFQLVKCFRDEDLRADRQPEFTQIDCEMAFVERDDVLDTFEGMAKHLFKEVRGVEMNEPFQRMTYDDAIRLYGSDKPDLRFGMQFVEMNEIVKGGGFRVFDDAEFVVGFNAEGCAGWSRKQTDALIDFVRRPQIGATGIVFARVQEDGSYKSTVDKFFTPEQVADWATAFNAKPGDLMMIMAGGTDDTRSALNELRLHVADKLELRDPNIFKPLWVVDFPLVEWDEDSQRYHAMHHPFTSPIPEDMGKMKSDPKSIKANAYDLVINGVEIGGGSIRIHDRGMQEQMFDLLGFTPEEAKAQFGFLMDAFEYGAPPHGGAAFGFDRWVALFGGRSDIREFIAFPKNNSGRDVMIDAPAPIDDVQLEELNLAVTAKAEQG